jgi:hypothetical protein
LVKHISNFIYLLVQEAPPNKEEDDDIASLKSEKETKEEPI